jgi:hypothetical protein
MSTLFLLQAAAIAVTDPTLYTTSTNGYIVGMFAISLHVNDVNQHIVSLACMGAALLGLIMPTFVIDTHGRTTCLQRGSTVVLVACLGLWIDTYIFQSTPERMLYLSETCAALILLLLAGQTARCHVAVGE